MSKTEIITEALTEPIFTKTGKKILLSPQKEIKKKKWWGWCGERKRKK